MQSNVMLAVSETVTWFSSMNAASVTGGRVAGACASSFESERATGATLKNACEGNA